MQGRGGGWIYEKLLFCYLIAPFVSWVGVIYVVKYEKEEMEEDGKMTREQKENKEKEQEDCQGQDSFE